MPYKDPERRKEFLRAYYRANAKKYSERQKATRQTEQGKAQRREAYLRNREGIRLKAQAFYRANSDRIKERSKTWRQDNRRRRNARERESLAKHPARKLASQYRKLINLKLKMYNVMKAARTIKLLGCDIHWLVAWLEIQFQSGMTWENYGPVWHVDHIKPCAAFDLSDPWQQQLCFHWTNLQPLFAWENLQKHSKWHEQVA